MNYTEPADLPNEGDPNDPHVFETELDVNAEQLATGHPASPEQIHKSQAVGALVRADALYAGYFPGVNILNGSDLYAQEGELVGIIGPNGAGKSTLLKAIFGLVHVNQGSVLLRDEDITNLRADQLVRRGVGFVPQTNNVFPSLTIEENMQMGAFQDPKSFDERFAKVIDIFPTLGERRKQRAGSLSGGERQMVAMGRALMMEPSVLLPAWNQAPAPTVRSRDRMPWGSTFRRARS